MANRPCIGGYICPHCGKKTTVVWNGNSRDICQHCNHPFNVKRQKMIDVNVLNTMKIKPNKEA